MTSFTGEMPRVTRQHAEGEGDGSESCAHCGSVMRQDQEWCLECGAARTLIHRPPDWRVGLTMIATVVVLALVGFAIVLVSLSTNANRELPSTSTAAATSTPAVAATPAVIPPERTAAAPAPAAISSWAVGLSGWTVQLSHSRSHAHAVGSAHRLAARGLRVGVLDSSEHPTMAPGLWIVFSGRYPGRQPAFTAAAGLKAKGLAHAVARQVAPPGGL